MRASISISVFSTSRTLWLVSCLRRKYPPFLYIKPTSPWRGFCWVGPGAEAADGCEDRDRFRPQDGGALALAGERPLFLPVAGAVVSQEVRLVEATLRPNMLFEAFFCQRHALANLFPQFLVVPSGPCSGSVCAVAARLCISPCRRRRSLGCICKLWVEIPCLFLLGLDEPDHRSPSVLVDETLKCTSKNLLVSQWPFSWTGEKVPVELQG